MDVLRSPAQYINNYDEVTIHCIEGILVLRVALDFVLDFVLNVVLDAVLCMLYSCCV